MTVDTLLRGLAEQGTVLTLDGRLEGGEFDTYAVTDGHGQRWVLKWSQGEGGLAEVKAMVARVERLRALGYPIPAHGPVVEVDGIVAYLQAFVPGTARDEIGHALLDRVLDLNALQAGAGAGEPSASLGWPEFMRRTLVEGLDEWSRHEPPREYSAATRALVEDIEAIGLAWDAVAPTQDLVHIDFHHRNLLRDNAGALSAVIDWAGARPGDRHFDLVTLAFAAPMASCEAGVEDRLWDHLRAMVPADTLVAYVAHMALRLVDFTIRVHPGPYVDMWLDISRRHLDRVMLRQ